MTRDDIIRMAREAGMIGTGEAGNELERLYREAILDALPRFAALIAAAVESKWKQAVIDELVNCHIYKQSHEDSPREALHDAICWNVEVALDPKVSSSAEALIRQGAAAEREACAKVCEAEAKERYHMEVWGDDLANGLAAAIRARGK